MKKMFKNLALVAALSLGTTSAFAGTIEREDNGTLEINVFANIIESFKVTIDNSELAPLASPSDQGLLDLNGGLLGFDGLASLAAGACQDDLGGVPSYITAAATDVSCAVNNVGGSASTSSLQFTADFAVAVEMSGPGAIDLSVAMLNPTHAAGTEVFANQSVQFVGAASQTVTGMIDQDTETLSWSGEAALSGGPAYDDTIIVTVTKQP